MKLFLLYILSTVILLSNGCSKESNIYGIWEHNKTPLVTYTFYHDKTGTLISKNPSNPQMADFKWELIDNAKIKLTVNGDESIIKLNNNQIIGWNDQVFIKKQNQDTSKTALEKQKLDSELLYTAQKASADSKERGEERLELERRRLSAQETANESLRSAQEDENESRRSAQEDSNWHINDKLDSLERKLR